MRVLRKITNRAKYRIRIEVIRCKVKIDKVSNWIIRRKIERNAHIEKTIDE